MGQSLLTDQQLQELAKDKRVTEQDLALLTPDEKRRFAVAKHKASTLGTAEDVATGVAKGGGETAFNLGNLAHSIPGVGDLTDALAQLGINFSDYLAGNPRGKTASGETAPNVSPDQMFAQHPDVLDPTNTAQQVGKTGEQIGEFFVGAGPARKMAIEGLVKQIPNKASAATMKTLNKAGALAGRTIGEAGNATAVAGIHGDDNPELSGEVAAAGVPASEGLAAGARALGTPLGRRVAPVLAAGGLLSSLPSLFGLGASMGMYNVAKKPIENALKNPRTIQKMERGARQIGTQGARVAAGGVDAYHSLQRRRLQP